MKLEEIDLNNEAARVDDRSPSTHDNMNMEENNMESDGIVHLSINERQPDPMLIPKWKFWHKSYRSRYDISATQRNLCGNHCRKSKCKVISWRAVIVSLLIFTAVVFISAAISRLAIEPPDDTPVTPTD